MRRLMIALAGLALAAPAALGQERRSDWGLMNCAKAKAAQELAICGDKELLQKDAVMSAEFTLLKDFMLMGGRGALQDDQREWLKGRGECKADKACLKKKYDTRIAELDKAFDFMRERR